MSTFGGRLGGESAKLSDFIELNFAGGFGKKQGPEAQSTSTQQSQQRQFFSDPDLVSGLAANLGGVASRSAADFSNFISNPTAHPAFQAAIQGLLAAQQPGIDQGFSDLSDAFRKAGVGTQQGGAYGAALGKFAGQVQRNQAETVSKALQNFFPQQANALFAPLAQIPSLASALKLSEGSSSGSSSSFFDPLRLQLAKSGGGGGSISRGKDGQFPSTGAYFPSPQFTQSPSGPAPAPRGPTSQFVNVDNIDFGGFDPAPGPAGIVGGGTGSSFDPGGVVDFDF